MTSWWFIQIFPKWYFLSSRIPRLKNPTTLVRHLIWFLSCTCLKQRGVCWFWLILLNQALFAAEIMIPICQFILFWSRSLPSFTMFSFIFCIIRVKKGWEMTMLRCSHLACQMSSRPHCTGGWYTGSIVKVCHVGGIVIVVQKNGHLLIAAAARVVVGVGVVGVGVGVGVAVVHIYISVISIPAPDQKTLPNWWLS